MKRRPGKICGRTLGQAAQGGFTLIEVVVAVVILGLAYVAVLQNFSLSLRNLLKLDGGRSALQEEYLLFEEGLRVTGEEEPPPEPLDGPVHLEGQRYKVVVVESENKEFVTLEIVRP